ncbi:MAG: sugar phosphate isomerase/epimerase [Victivallaceae bacterium]|nr:sugar phosphate isomerase/epimerase [Victivallaceae bacterium]
MKIGVIAQRLQRPLFECLETAAELQLDGVQLYSVSTRENLLDFSPAKRREIVRHCDDLGMEISAVCGEIGGHGFRIAEKNPERIELTCRNIDLALDMGCRIVTTHIGVVRNNRNDELYRNQVNALREAGRYAAAHNAVVAIETGPEPAITLKMLLEDVDSPGVGINFDPANLVMVLGADEVSELEILAPYVVHTHAKDGVNYRSCDPEKVYDAFAKGGIKQLFADTGEIFRETPLGQGSVKWEQYLSALEKIAPDIFLAIEREAGSDPVEDTRLAINFLSKQPCLSAKRFPEMSHR